MLIMIVDDNNAHIRAVSTLFKAYFAQNKIHADIAPFTNPEVDDWLNLPGTANTSNIICLLDLKFDTISSNKSGFDTIKLLRSHRKTKDIYILACTGNTISEEDCIALGFNGCVRKPVTIDKLIGIIEGYYRHYGELNVTDIR